MTQIPAVSAALSFVALVSALALLATTHHDPELRGRALRVLEVLFSFGRER
ncbi:hypothetical protein [Streptomyces sp. BA2]|uniref:hypothetical protein n=1 Tax=Streptomyces sp. BA2 TaxID=436595 RepID=UPI00132400A2|nr:hypothetical protein [Streptomyces sp. BA2]MWA14645.1 hypothetical protein [Streptomyces sp. BA2]